MNIKMIVTDLDNTLLRHDKTVSEYTVDVFKRIRKRGLLLAFATARDFRFVTEYIVPLTGINPDILIAANGALARYNGKDLYKKMIPYSTVSVLMQHFGSVRCVSTENTYYLSDEYANDHWSIGKRNTVITDFKNAIENDAFYLDGNADKQALPEKNHDIRIVTYSDVSIVSIVHREATKLNALITTGNVLNIKKDDIIVFGDDYSDIELLSNYNNSIAVSNAINECKKAAKYICDSNENDGVARWLEENVL